MRFRFFLVAAAVFAAASAMGAEPTSVTLDLRVDGYMKSASGAT